MPCRSCGLECEHGDHARLEDCVTAIGEEFKIVVKELKKQRDEYKRLCDIYREMIEILQRIDALENKYNVGDRNV